MKSDILKSLALRAKNRLLNKGLRDSYSNANIKIIDNNDEEFFAKAKAVIEDESKAYNPLKYLMDDNILLKLDDRGREKYLFETIEKYRKVREQLDRQNFVC